MLQSIHVNRPRQDVSKKDKSAPINNAIELQKKMLPAMACCTHVVSVIASTRPPIPMANLPYQTSF